MEDADFTDEFCRFIQAAIPSVEAAELLLVLARRPDAELSAAAAVAGLPRGVALTEAQAGAPLQAVQAGGPAGRRAGGVPSAPPPPARRAGARRA